MEIVKNQHWNQMICDINPLVNSSHPFFISESSPPSYIIPNGFYCIVYHPVSLNNQEGIKPSKKTKEKIIKFIENHNCINNNVTELTMESLDRFLSTPSFLGVLFKEKEIVGTILTLLFRVQYNDLNIITSYTTFLCIHQTYRNKGFAMILIRSIMKEGYYKYNCKHGYYLTFNTHHNINSKINSWYRPINIKKSLTAGFTLQTFNSELKQKIFYHIPKPKLLPVKVNYEHFDLVLKIFQLKKNSFCLSPTKQELKWLCDCFDVYIVGSDGLFILFPMVSKITSTSRKVYIAHLTLMIGDVIQEALWIAKESNYDLLYGWCSSDITFNKIETIKGLITTANCYIEFYNCKRLINNFDMFVPIF